MPPDPGSPSSEIVLALARAGAVLFVAGDLLILGLWIAGLARREPLLARRWSLADLFLGLQFVIGFVIFAGLLGIFAWAFLSALRVIPPLNPDLSRITGPVFYLMLLPALLAQQAALVVLPLAVVWLKYRGTVADLGLRIDGERGRRLLAVGVLLAVVLLPLNDLMETLAQRLLFDWVRLPHAEELRELARSASAVTYLQDLARNPLALALMGIVVGILGPIAEEVFFRGFAYRVFKERFGMPAGIALSAFLFALIHMNPVALVPIFLIGVVLALLYERTGSLAAPIGLHCANNLLATAFALLAPDFSFWDRFIPH